MSKVRYVTVTRAQRAWWDDLYQIHPLQSGPDRVQVIEESSDPQPTGLLDAQGNELFRFVEKRPIGFRKLKEY